MKKLLFLLTAVLLTVGACKKDNPVDLKPTKIENPYNVVANLSYETGKTNPGSIYAKINNSGKIDTIDIHVDWGGTAIPGEPHYDRMEELLDKEISKKGNFNNVIISYVNYSINGLINNVFEDSNKNKLTFSRNNVTINNVESHFLISKILISINPNDLYIHINVQIKDYESKQFIIYIDNSEDIFILN